MVVLPGKFVYLATPHTASVATTVALATLNGISVSSLSQTRELGLDPSAFINAHHASLKQLQKKHPDLLTGTETVFTTVRHPCDLIVTWWLRQHRPLKHAPPFEEFVQSIRNKKTYGPYVKDGRIFWHDNVDQWLRYETLENDLNGLLSCLGLPAVVLPHENVTGDKEPWPSYYNEPTLAIVRENFGKEAEQYGYYV